MTQSLRNRGPLLLRLRGACFKWQQNVLGGRMMKTLPSQTQTHNCSISERLKPSCSCSRFVICRDFQEKDDNQFELMKMPHVCNQDVTRSFNNWKSFLRIVMQYDEDFRPHVFLVGAQQAILHVSKCISEGNFRALSGLLTSKAIREVKQNFEKFSAHQKDWIAISGAKVHRHFIYDVRLKESPLLKAPWAKGFTEIIPATKAEIFVVLEGSHLHDTTAESMAGNDVRFFCNYKFEKSFEKYAGDSSWIITQLNHFMPPVEH